MPFAHAAGQSAPPSDGKASALGHSSAQRECTVGSEVGGDVIGSVVGGEVIGSVVGGDVIGSEVGGDVIGSEVPARSEVGRNATQLHAAECMWIRGAINRNFGFSHESRPPAHSETSPLTPWRSAMARLLRYYQSPPVRQAIPAGVRARVRASLASAHSAPFRA